MHINEAHRLFFYTKRYWKQLSISIVSASLVGVLTGAPAYVLRHIVDLIFVNRLSYLIIPFIICFIAIFAFKGIFMYLSSYYVNWVGNRVVNDIRHDFFARIIHFPIGFFRQHSSGTIISHVLNDMKLIQTASSDAIKDGVRSIFETLFLLGVAFVQNWQLTLVTLFIAPLITYAIRLMGRSMKKSAREMQFAMGLVSSTVQEACVGIREIKMSNAEDLECSRFEQKLTNYFSAAMRNAHAEACGPAIIEVLAISAVGVVFYIAARQVLSGAITSGQLTSSLAAMFFGYQPLKRISSAYATLQNGLAAAHRIFTLMDQTFPASTGKRLMLTAVDQGIKFDHVSFSYDGTTPVLKDITLTIPRGGRIAITGPSGSGKSTLCDLLLGFIAPTNGAVYINHINLMDVTPHSLRERIGYVGQHPFLFNDTVEENVTYAAKAPISHDMVVHACKQAHAEEFIEKMPHTYATLVGENGSLLSGGQKQRLTIARALLAHRDILIFDEATSALDSHAEAMIVKTLTELPRSITVIVISHRTALTRHMDQIFELRDGTLYEQSTPDASACAAIPHQEEIV